jgi:hypothetical protein
MFPSGAFRAHGEFVLLKKKQCKRREGKTHSFVSEFYWLCDFYLINKFSRSWSRPTKDLVVRN